MSPPAMSTSLSRQLSQLRASAPSAALQSAAAAGGRGGDDLFSRGPFLVDLAAAAEDDLDLNGLRRLAAEAFARLAAAAPALEAFKGR